MKKTRQWLILQEPKEVYNKALKWYSNWKLNYIRFLKKIIELNPYVWFSLDKKNNVWITLKHLEGRYYCNPRYKNSWFLKPTNVALSGNVIKLLPNNYNINKRTWDFLLSIIDIDWEIKKVEEYIYHHIKRYPTAYIYRLTPDIIWFIHNIIIKWYKEWTVIYKTNKLKEWQH